MYSLRRSIFQFFVGLLALALCVNFVLVYRSAWLHTRAQVERQLQSGIERAHHHIHASANGERRT